MDLFLNNKHVLITGSSKGIGLAIAEAFLKEGAKVCINSRNSNELSAVHNLLKEKYGPEKIIKFSTDISKTENLLKLRSYIFEKWERLDIVISNVGFGSGSSAAIPDPLEWSESWGSNFTSAYLTTETFLEDLKDTKGSLIYISSIAGIESIGAPTHYSVAKSAVLALSKNISKKLSNTVRVNVVAPGNIYFKGGTWHKKLLSNENEVKKYLERTVPMNRLGDPEDVSNVVLFLSSNKAKFITGSVITVDGGQTSGVF